MSTARHQQVRRLMIPAAWPARPGPAARQWAIIPADLAPILLTGAYLIAGILQPASCSPMRKTIGRTKGPVFLTDRRARAALAAADLDPVSGRARLSYRRAEEIFTETTRPLAHPDITNPQQLADAPGWTLHDLWHSALTHAAENGANTGTLLAYSGHASVASLARYTRVSPDALTRWQARRDPHRRR